MAELFPDRAARVRVFGIIDVVVQAGALLSQLFITGRLAQKLGVRVLLAIVPLLVGVGFIGLALMPSFAVLAALMIAPHRRVRVRPARPRNALRAAGCREQVQGEERHRHCRLPRRRCRQRLGKTALDMFGQGAGLVAVAGAICALLWGYLGWQLGKQADRRAEVRVHSCGG